MLIIVYFYNDASLLSLYYFANYMNIQEINSSQIDELGNWYLKG